MHGDNGCGYFNPKSTGFPHIPHTVCVAYIFFLFRSNAPRCDPSRSGLYTMPSSSFFDREKSSRLSPAALCISLFTFLRFFYLFPLFFISPALLLTLGILPIILCTLLWLNHARNNSHSIPSVYVFFVPFQRKYSVFFP